MKLIAFNVNGVRAILKKTFADDFKTLAADIFVMEETKYSEVAHTSFPFEAAGYQLFWTNSKVKKGYSGVAIYTKKEPLNVYYGLNNGKYDDEGRVITLEFPNFYLVGAYVPNSGEGLKRLPFRLGFEKDMRDYLSSLDQKKPVIMTGDLNVAHEEIDIKNPDTNRHNPGFTDEERSNFSQLLSLGFIDTFRALHPNTVAYSWWSYRFHAREKNAGWRIDYFVVSKRLLPAVKDSLIRNDILGSDHCPIELDINL